MTKGLIHSSRREKGGYTVSLTTFVAKIRDASSGNVLSVNALADGGADHSVLSARAARKLGLWEEGKGVITSFEVTVDDGVVIRLRSLALTC